MAMSRRRIGIVRFALTLTRRHQAAVLWLAVVTLVAGSLDAVGLALVLPTIEFLVGADTVVGEIQIIEWTRSAFNAVGLTFELKWTVAVLFAVMTTRSVTLLLQYWLMAKFRARFEGDLKANAYGDIMHAQWPFFLRQRAGILVNALTVESGRAGDAFGALNEIIGTVVNMLVYLTLACAVSWQLTLCTLAATLALIGVFNMLSRIAGILGAGASEANASLLSHIDESLLGAKIVKSEASEDLVESRFRRLVWRQARINELLGIIRGLYSSVSELVFLALLVAVLVLGTRIIGLPAITMLLFALLFLRVIQRARVFQTSLISVSGFLPGLDVVWGIAKDARTSHAAAGGRQFDRLSRGVGFENVTYGYDAERLVLKGVTLSVPAGSMVALVGPSGVGKTTIVDLSIGLLHPKEGRVLVDGWPLESYDSRTWRSKLAYVSQETILFNDSVLRNIAWSRPDATESQVREVARLARAAEFIEAMPEGYATVIGDRGMRLSGGQRQRLALARALLREPELLILDEATSELDTEAEAGIQASIESIRDRTTILIVAHRLSTVTTADILYVLADGAVVESGSASDLLAQRGVFYRLYNQALIGADSSDDQATPDLLTR